MEDIRFLRDAPPKPKPHYHGDLVRVLFVVAAILIMLAQFSGGSLPLSTFTSILAVVALVLAAGITNPVQSWILWVDVAMSATGLLVFGTLALSHFRAGGGFSTDGLFVALLALTFVLALYFATRTLRGLLLVPRP